MVEKRDRGGVDRAFEFVQCARAGPIARAERAEDGGDAGVDGSRRLLVATPRGQEVDAGLLESERDVGVERRRGVVPEGEPSNRHARTGDLGAAVREQGRLAEAAGRH